MHNGLPAQVLNLSTEFMVQPDSFPFQTERELLTCLRCNTLNEPSAKACSHCGALLVVPDEEMNLLPLVSGRTHVGQVRKNNEDNLHLWAGEGVILALIADGMGGAAAGEEASRLVVETVEKDFTIPKGDSGQFQVLTEPDLEKRLSDAILDANRAVLDRALSDVNLRGMGTTSTLALIRGNRLLVAHVGDSRAYIVDRTGAIAQVTSDHSFVQALVASGHLTPEEANQHPMGNVLYRALGQSLDLDVDTYAKTLHAGDSLVLCSDGLSKHLTPNEIGKVIAQYPRPDDSTLKLIEIANERGGEDNISVVVIAMTPVDDIHASGLISI
ncbi:MAG: Stp1/IreP family PP2C-type Ser/Thr phosphatase [Anaerolineae bacterium]